MNNLNFYIRVIPLKRKCIIFIFKKMSVGPKGEFQKILQNVKISQKETEKFTQKVS